MKLGLRLLQERARKGSFWWPYISNLPETYSVPIFFPGEDIKNLQYAPLLQQVNVPLDRITAKGMMIFEYENLMNYLVFLIGK